MNYDALTLAAMRDALWDRLEYGRVQRIVRPSTLSIGIEIYARERHQLYLSAEPQEPTILLADDKLRRGAEVASPLQLLLRKYVAGARLQEIAQPPLERVLHLRFEGEEGTVTLVCELMGRLSNLILLYADGTILDAAKRVPSAINRYRVILPGHPYVPPPAQDKLSPLVLSGEQLAQELALIEGPLWRRLVNAVSGISPLLAKEIVYRAAIEIDSSAPIEGEAIARLIRSMHILLSLPETGAWAPCVAYQGQGEDRHAVAYAPYELTHLPDREPYESLAAALARYLASRKTPSETAMRDPYYAARRRLRHMVSAALERQRARLASLLRSQVSEDELAALQLQASAVLAMSWQIMPGQQLLRVFREQVTGDPADCNKPPLEIPLDPSLSPSENAQALFRSYRKRQAAAAQVPDLIAAVERELAYLQQLNAEIDLVENRPQLDEIETALIETGLGPPTPSKYKLRATTSEPLRIHAPDGTLILVGRNGAQNQEITFRRAGPSDLWLHAHGVPGAHVIVRCGDEAVAEETVLRAARLAAYYSASRHEGRVQVDCTLRRYVRPIKGGRPGMVTYSQERTLVVTPSAHKAELETT